MNSYLPSMKLPLVFAVSSLMLGCASIPPSGPMSFFVTSVGVGKGADLGGLAGADAHCQKLATAAGQGNRTWHAYLSTSSVAAAQGVAEAPAVHARDRIGKGPWFNAKGVLIAKNVEDLHDANHISKANSLNEMGQVVNGAGDKPNLHDILTGSRTDGTAFSPSPNLTCGNWTQSGDGTAMVGHHDRTGLVPDAWAVSWNSSHQTRGCSQEALASTGGGGLLYCFAANN